MVSETGEVASPVTSRPNMITDETINFIEAVDGRKTMKGAKAFSDENHDLSVVDIAKLIDLHRDDIRLPPVKIGTTKFFRHQRDLQPFKKFNEHKDACIRAEHGLFCSIVGA
ncbi:hypothetical protein [Maritimibacter sp. 55A14]|uniref:hypothetical protein n=1 Tax=Maritimibacter sp. 55A14 TaxID=2174844 RepID=UPI0011B25D93|nr:hypothetical protein [Maritimibacter sp. 55A14]